MQWKLDSIESRNLDFGGRGGLQQLTWIACPNSQKLRIGFISKLCIRFTGWRPADVFEKQDYLDTFEEQDCPRRRKNLDQLKWTTRETEKPEKSIHLSINYYFNVYKKIMITDE